MHHATMQMRRKYTMQELHTKKEEKWNTIMLTIKANIGKAPVVE